MLLAMFKQQHWHCACLLYVGVHVRLVQMLDVSAGAADQPRPRQPEPDAASDAASDAEPGTADHHHQQQLESWSGLCGSTSEDAELDTLLAGIVPPRQSYPRPSRCCPCRNVYQSNPEPEVITCMHALANVCSCTLSAAAKIWRMACKTPPDSLV